MSDDITRAREHAQNGGVPRQPVASITITLFSTGEVGIETLIQDEILAFGLHEKGRDALRMLFAMRAQQAAQHQRVGIASPGMLDNLKKHLRG